MEIIVMKEDRIEWMRQAYLKVEALSRSLRERVAGVPSENLERWIPELGEQFEAFRAHCVKHMSLEEADGYMTSVVECRPGLSCEVERLQHEHQAAGGYDVDVGGERVAAKAHLRSPYGPKGARIRA